MRLALLCVFTSFAVIFHCFGLDEIDFKERYHHLKPFVESAQMYRHGVLETDKEKKALLACMVADLPMYESSDRLETAVEALLQDQFNNQLPTYHIVAIAGTELSGNSSDPVFLVVDEQNSLLLVVKAFEKPADLKGKFLREISSLDFLITNQHNIRINTPYPIGVGQTLCHHMSYGLLAQSPAKGERFDSYVKALKEASEDDYAAKYQQLQKAFQVAAHSISNLNSSDVNSDRESITAAMVKKLRKKTKELVDSPAAAMIADSISVDALIPFVETLIQKTQQYEYIKGYSHFSAHTANVFYDSTAKEISYIDVAKMFESYKFDGRPLSFSAYDVVRFAHSFRKVAVPFMDFDDMQKLVDEFKQHYFDGSNDPHSRQLVRFLEVESAIGRLNSYHDYEQIKDPAKKELHRRVFEMSKKSLILEMR